MLVGRYTNPRDELPLLDDAVLLQPTRRLSEAARILKNLHRHSALVLLTRSQLRDVSVVDQFADGSSHRIVWTCP